MKFPMEISHIFLLLYGDQVNLYDFEFVYLIFYFQQHLTIASQTCIYD